MQLLYEWTIKLALDELELVVGYTIKFALTNGTSSFSPRVIPPTEVLTSFGMPQFEDSASKLYLSSGHGDSAWRHQGHWGGV